MPNPQHLDHAPIKEAIIYIGVQLPSTTTFEALQPAIDATKPQYPIIRPIDTFGVMFDIQEHTATPSPNQKIGTALWDAQGSKVVQYRLDNFSHNRLRPYSDWSDFFEEAMRWWRLYIQSVDPPLVNRLGLKYTNRFLLPEFELEKYFLFVPKQPAGVTGELAHFLYQMKFHQPDTGIDVLITQTMEENLEDEKLPIIFDIDVYKDVSLRPSDESIAGIFQTFHNMKNEIFFQNLTDEAIALCQ